MFRAFVAHRVRVAWSHPTRRDYSYPSRLRILVRRSSCAVYASAFRGEVRRAEFLHRFLYPDWTMAFLHRSRRVY
jgi:hypothetical protein